MIDETFRPTMQTIHKEPEFQFPDLALGHVVSGIVRLQQDIATLRMQKANLQEKLRKETEDHCNQHIQWRNFENGYEKEIRKLEEQVKELDHSNKVRELKISALKVEHEAAIQDLRKKHAQWEEEHFNNSEMEQKRLAEIIKNLKRKNKHAKKGIPKKKTRKVHKDKGTKVPAENP